jgi:small-conductance mechanosensitive channel
MQINTSSSHFARNRDYYYSLPYYTKWNRERKHIIIQNESFLSNLEKFIIFFILFLVTLGTFLNTIKLFQIDTELNANHKY